jgi:hypothetical protein
LVQYRLGGLAGRFFAQHSRQYTGLLGSGLKGTSHSVPHSEQTALCISFSAIGLFSLLFSVFLGAEGVRTLVFICVGSVDIRFAVKKKCKTVGRAGFGRV